MKRIKESRKPFKENEATYQWISQFLDSKGLEMKRDFEDQEGYYLKQDGKIIGYLIVNPVEYYLAGEDESCYYEGSVCDEFIEDFNDCFNSLNLLEGKRKVREMARTIKDYDTFEGSAPERNGLSPDQKSEAFQRFIDFLEYIGATWEAPNIEKQVSGKFWDLEFTLNYAGMGGRGYTIDVMNAEDGTIQDQWVGDTYSDFLADFRELKNEYQDLYTDVDE